MADNGGIAELNKGLQLLMVKILDEGTVGRNIRPAIISFNSGARLERSLSPVSIKSIVPILKAEGTTNLAAAMELLKRTILEDAAVIEQLGEHAYRPAVFLFTDGRPTDAVGKELKELTDHASWFRPLNELRKLQRWQPRVYPYGFGEAKPEILKLMISESPPGGKTVSDAVLEARFQQTSGETVAESVGRIFKELFSTLIAGAGAAATGNSEEQLGRILDESFYGQSAPSKTRKSAVDQYL
jgi:hypothetical protein